MLKYALFIVVALPSMVPAADYIEGRSTYSERRMCNSEQSGAIYCVVSPPLEKLTTDCDAGVDCHHMESGQHYSLQRPLTVD